jgi:uncharacterized protein (TIGR03437 family)
MCRRATIRLIATTAVLVALNCSIQAQVQGVDWRHIGNSAIDLALPAIATGQVDRVWYSPDGSLLLARTASGRVFQTGDFEQWRRVADPKLLPPSEDSPPMATVPQAGLKLARRAALAGRLYGVGRDVYRSDDGGVSWANVTAYKGVSILGDGLSDVASSPRDPDEVTVASSTGVWRSLDGGQSWTGLNDFLPNLPAGRLTGIPGGMRGVRLSIADSGAEIEWAPGEKTAWKPLRGGDAQRDREMRFALSQVLKRTITAIAAAKDYVYAGDSEGRLQVSADAGRSWGMAFKAGDLGAVEAIWVDLNDPRVAIAAMGPRNSANPNQGRSTYALRTMNGGIFWDDITANLPDAAAARGVTADRASGAVYVATDAGIYYTITDLASAGRATQWTALSDRLPAVAATDVKLDGGANQLYAALDGYGVYVAIAPHRLRDPRVTSAADYTARPAAPGALLSVLGTRVESAHAASLQFPVLDASDNASQIQVPFEAKGNSVTLSLEAAAARFVVGFPLQSVSPAIFVDPEGTPLIMDAATGVLLDSTKPARSNTRIQILATGLGRVKPDWPTGMAAPIADPPRVLASVRGYLDRAPLQVTEASLAPGYVGFYLVEIQLPRVINAGPAELYLESEGQQSNRVRLYMEP